jgi:hypothetical protein
VTTAATYARKSTEQNGIANKVKSVAQQVEHARAYATAPQCPEVYIGSRSRFGASDDCCHLRS